MGTIEAKIAGALIKTGRLTVEKKGNNGWSTYKGGRYCGPGWGFTYRDVLDGKVRELPEAIDAIDLACKMHDECYEDNGYFTQGCNLVLTVDLVKVVTDAKSSPEQRLDAALMAAVFFIESQIVDVPVLVGREMIELKNRIAGSIREAGNTFETAIKGELRARGVVLP